MAYLNSYYPSYFVFHLNLNKSPDVFRKDVYIAVAAYVLLMLSAHIILEVRSQEGLAIEELTKISTIDKLTYLLNKGALLSAINNYFDRRKPGDPCGMCIIDVDNFKQVNDNFGHGIGDKLLSNIGDLLRKNFRESDYIGRFGGDEFIVFLPGIARLDIIEMRCRTMQMMLSDLDLGTGESFTLSIVAIIDTGDQVVHYIKERAGFNHIPIIAIAANEDSFVEARNAGADKVFLTGENTKSLKKAVDSLIN